MTGQDLKTSLSLRLKNDEKDLLKKIVELTGLNQSQILRLALKEFFYNQSEGVKNEIRELWTVNKIHYTINEIKRVRWINHIKADASRWLKLMSTIRSGKMTTDLKPSERIIRDMTPDDLDRITALENKLLGLINDLKKRHG